MAALESKNFLLWVFVMFLLVIVATVLPYLWVKQTAARDALAARRFLVEDVDPQVERDFQAVRDSVVEW